MNDIGWTDAEIRESSEKSNEIKDAYMHGYNQARKEFERPQGEWKLHGMIYYCSVCGHDYEQGGNNFCGNCGAKMKGGAE